MIIKLFKGTIWLVSWVVAAVLLMGAYIVLFFAGQKENNSTAITTL